MDPHWADETPLSSALASGLRWALVLPVVAATAFAFFFPVFALVFGLGESPSRDGLDVPLTVAACLAWGACPVWLGTAMAPSHKVIVGAVVALAASVYGMSFGSAFDFPHGSFLAGAWTVVCARAAMNARSAAM